MRHVCRTANDVVYILLAVCMVSSWRLGYGVVHRKTEMVENLPVGIGRAACTREHATCGLGPVQLAVEDCVLRSHVLGFIVGGSFGGDQDGSILLKASEPHGCQVLICIRATKAAAGGMGFDTGNVCLRKASDGMSVNVYCYHSTCCHSILLRHWVASATSAPVTVHHTDDAKLLVQASCKILK